MNDRPKWTQAIRMFIGDEILDEKYGYPMDGSDDELSDEIERAVNDILCRHYGHDIQNDQCMKPEHRYCVYCFQPETAIIAAAEHVTEVTT
jgi:hypothetical protein